MSLELAARHIAAKGRNGDSMLVHMTPGEVAGLSALARAHGGEITVNPDTGLPEANFLKKLLPAIAGAAVSGITGFNPMTSALLVGGATGLASGSLSKGLAAGLGAYGGAGLMGGLATLGGQALAAQQAAAMPAEAFAEGLSPAQLTGATQQPLMDRLAAGAQRLTQEGGPTAFMNAMGGAKPLMQAGLAGLAGMSAFAPDRAVPTVTRQPGQLRPMVFQRRQTPLEEAQRTGRYFEDSLTPLPVINAAEGGLMPDDGEPVQFMADGGQAQALDMNRLRGMQQADAINYLRGITPQQLNITQPSYVEDGQPAYFANGQAMTPTFAADQEGAAGALTGFQRTITPTFDPTYAGGRYGDYAAYYDPQGALQDIRFNPQERHGGFLSENLQWIGPLAVGGAALAGGLLGGAGAGATTTGSAYDALINSVFPATPYEAYTQAAINAANAGAAGTAAGTLTNTGLGALGSTLAGAASNPFVQGAVIAGLTGAAAGGERPTTTTTAGTDLNIPSATNPIILAGSAAPTGAGGTPGMRTQSEIAFDYLMGRRPTSRAGLADLAGAAAGPGMQQQQQRPPLRPQVLTEGQFARWSALTPAERPIYAGLASAYNQAFTDPALGNADARALREYMQANNLAAADVSRLSGIDQNTINTYLGQADLTDSQLSRYQLLNADDASRYAALSGAFNSPGDTAQDAAQMRQVMQQHNLSPAEVARITGIDQATVDAYLGQAAAPAAPAAPAITPQDIIGVYQNTVGRGAMSEAEFVQRAMQDYGVSANQLGEARNLLLSSQGMADGGLAALARGGGVGHLGDYSDGGRLLRGPGDGVSDDIPATINGKRPARLADGEFVIPARIVSELGNGSTEAGARQLYAMMDRIQKRRSKTVGKKNVAVDSKAHKLLPA